MSYALYVIAGFTGMGAFLSIGRIGKERKPITPGDAAYIVLIDAAFIVALVLAARRLS